MTRYDAQGLFWHDVPGQPKVFPQPRIPDTGWTTPSEFPRLEAAKILAVDTETHDLGLERGHGPGWAWEGGGHIVGISVGTDDGHRWYFPMRHEVGGGNLNPKMVLRWAKDELCRKSQPKVGANLMYDYGWLLREGVKMEGPLIDVQFAEPLLDEYAYSYALEVLAQKYLGEGKVDEDLYIWLAKAYGGKATRKAQIGNIYRSPVALAGPYAESDVDLPLRIWEHQQKKLEEENLMPIFDMECKLIPMLVAMRMNGVRVDVPGAERAREVLLKREAELDKQLGGINVDANADLQKAFDKEDIYYPTTAKGNPSFTKDFLSACNHPLAKAIMAKRRLAKARSTFIEGYVLDKHKNGRIHCEFHPLRTDANGTVSGRLSSSNPNLTNIPARDPEIKKMVRGLYLPEEGEEWVSIDFSQIEYRLMVHAAVGKGAEEARQQFINNPDTDFHQFTQDMIVNLLGREEFKDPAYRKPTKNINFGKIFGMSEATLKRQLPGLTDEEAEMFFEAYEEAMPYATSTANRARKVASTRGYILTVLKRRARFPFWESQDWELRKDLKWNRNPEIMRKQVDAERQLYLTGAKQYKGYSDYPRPGIQRAMLNKSLNCFTQGSGADILKKSMLDAWEAGLPVPLVTVHDELDQSIPFGSEGEQQIKLTKECMENAVELKVPVLVDIERGPNWGNLK